MSGPRRPAIEAPEIHFDAEHPHEEFFAPWREARALRYGSPSAPPRNRLPWRRSRRRRAVVTIVHDEAVFLPLWLGYYSRYFAADDIYVLDNDSSDGSTDRDGFVRVPTPHPSVDHTWMAETLAAFQEELLDRYDVVLVADADEIISPSRHGALSISTSTAWTRSSSTRSATRSCTCRIASHRSTSAGRFSINAAIGSPTMPTTNRFLPQSR